jgi:hypothetical protein
MPRFLLLVCILSIGGYYPVFKLSQWEVRKEMKRKLKLGVPEKELHHINANLKVEWVEEGREFRYHGEMYDIIRTETVNDKPVFVCISDEEEESLFSQLDRIVDDELDHGNSPAKQKGNLLIKVLAGLTYLTPENYALTVSSGQHCSNFRYNSLYHFNFSAEILHPPLG